MSLAQGWEFSFLMFTLLLKVTLFKERLWMIRSHLFVKRATESESFSLLFTKEGREWFACDSPFALKTFVVFNMISLFFNGLSPFYAQLANCSRRSVALFKRAMWAIRSPGSLKKEQNSDLLFGKSESLFRSFTHKKSDWLEKPKSKFL